MINKVLLTVIVSVIVAQGVKMLLHLIKDKKIGFADLVVTGGMPSTHSASVSSLFFILLILEGWTNITVVALVLFMIVITDSFGVRRTVGEEGLVLRKIIKRQNLKSKKLHIALGHKPIEVTMGILLGFLIALIIS